MLLQNTSAMALNKNPNSQLLAESEPGLGTGTTELKGVRAQGAAEAQPQCPKLHPPHRAHVPFGVCPAAQFDKKMLPHSLALTHLSQTTS